MNNQGRDDKEVADSAVAGGLCVVGMVILVSFAIDTLMGCVILAYIAGAVTVGWGLRK